MVFLKLAIIINKVRESCKAMAEGFSGGAGGSLPRLRDVLRR